MTEIIEQTTEDLIPELSPEVTTEPVEASEQLSEEIQVGETKIVFKEPTEKQNPKKEVRMEAEGLIKSDYFTEDEEWAATVIGETPDGKPVQVVKRSNGHGYACSFRTGGTLPPELQGWFTTFDKAEQAARTYLNSKWDTARAEATNS